MVERTAPRTALCLEFRIHDLGLKVKGVGLKIYASDFGVEIFGSRDAGWGLRRHYRVEGSRLEVKNLKLGGENLRLRF